MCHAIGATGFERRPHRAYVFVKPRPGRSLRKLNDEKRMRTTVATPTFYAVPTARGRPRKSPSSPENRAPVIVGLADTEGQSYASNLVLARRFLGVGATHLARAGVGTKMGSSIPRELEKSGLRGRLRVADRQYLIWVMPAQEGHFSPFPSLREGAGP
jgi:hypothetical protein